MSITFLTRDEAFDFIARDPDRYMHGFSVYDLRARGVSSVREYIDRSCRLAVNFSTRHQQNLARLCSSVDISLRYTTDDDSQWAHIINPIKLMNLPWKFALIDGGTQFENGFPHTRHDIIFLFTHSLALPSEELWKLLLHEKVHVYQRVYRSEYNSGLLHMGYTVACPRRFCAKRSRSNPDLDEYVYKNPQGQLLLAYYPTDYPSSIGDVSYASSSRVEHPNEEIAYHISDAVLQVV